MRSLRVVGFGSVDVSDWNYVRDELPEPNNVIIWLRYDFNDNKWEMGWGWVSKGLVEHDVETIPLAGRPETCFKPVVSQTSPHGYSHWKYLGDPPTLPEREPWVWCQ